MSDRTPPRDSRKVKVPAPGSGSPGLPPQPGAPPQARPAPNGTARPTPRAPAPAPAATTPPGAPRPPQPTPAQVRRAYVAAPEAAPSRPAAPRTATTAPPGGPRSPSPRQSPTRRRRRLLPHRPKLRRLLLLSSLLMPLLLLVAAVGGWLYARSVYDKVEKIPLADVLTTSGTGTNYLIVGSDSRDVEDLVDAGLNPEAFEDGGGSRSDTMLVLRFVDGHATMLSIPRDLYVPIAETGGSSKINSAYNGGPRRLVMTVQQSLGIPIHHYMEVDFVSFARLVDALGGVTIEIAHPAYDTHTGFRSTTGGKIDMDGPTALAFVRSRHYVEVVDGDEQPDYTGDLGRVQRQQKFLSAVFGKLGSSRNPFTLARAASSASGGLRVDDTLGLTDAIRLAWRLRSLDPESIPLPVRVGSNSSGSVLFLVQPEADGVLAQFR